VARAWQVTMACCVALFSDSPQQLWAWYKSFTLRHVAIWPKTAPGKAIIIVVEYAISAAVGRCPTDSAASASRRLRSET
jgi:hypothetical protein